MCYGIIPAYHDENAGSFLIYGADIMDRIVCYYIALSYAVICAVRRVIIIPHADLYTVAAGISDLIADYFKPKSQAKPIIVWKQ